MINLIYNELYNIFHKKSIYFLLFFIFLFCLLNNILYKINYDVDGKYIEDTIDINLEIKNLEKKLENVNDSKYIELKTKLDVLNIMKDYNSNSWQYIKANDYFYDVKYNINYYSLYNNEELLNFYLDKDEIYLDRYFNNDYISFYRDRLYEIDNIENNKENELEREILNYRIKYRINDEDNYLNRALIDYYNSSLLLYNYDKDNLNYKDKIKYNDLVSNKNISKYIFINRVNLKKENNLYSCLKTILEDYELFIILLISLISSNIICEEFHKGTIKLLLARPYSRSKLLLSKYISVGIVTLLAILFLILIELWIGGVIFGYDSLKIPVIVYSFKTDNLVIYNLFIYMFKRIIFELPKIMFLSLLCFFLSIISLNSVLVSIITISIYIFNDIIMNFLSKYSIFKYIIFSNYNFLMYIDGNINRYFAINFTSSVFIYILYFLLIFLFLFVIFKKRDIKNV